MHVALLCVWCRQLYGACIRMTLAVYLDSNDYSCFAELHRQTDVT